MIRDIKPAQCTLVPDGNDQLTSDHGFDLTQNNDELRVVIDELKELGVRVSLFMDPIPEQMQLAAKLGADRIELYTESYANAVMKSRNIEQVLSDFVNTAQAAHNAGLGVNAGHDLNLDNLAQFKQAIPCLLYTSPSPRDRTRSRMPSSA